MSVSVTYNGPIFDGTAASDVQAFLDEATRDVADEGVDLVKTELKPRLKNPTGYYLSHIQTDRSTKGALVTDGGVVYGPWLEGVGSRNKRSRFKGYHHWRLTRQRLQARAADIAERSLPKYVERMNGS